MSETKRLIEKDRPEKIDEDEDGTGRGSTAATTSGSTVLAKIRRRQSPPFSGGGGGTDYGSSGSKYGTLDTSAGMKRSLLVDTYPRTHITRKQFAIAFIAFIVFAAAVGVTLILGLPRLDAKRTEYFAAKFYESTVRQTPFHRRSVVVTGSEGKVEHCFAITKHLITNHLFCFRVLPSGRVSADTRQWQCNGRRPGRPLLLSGRLAPSHPFRLCPQRPPLQHQRHPHRLLQRPPSGAHCTVEWQPLQSLSPRDDPSSARSLRSSALVEHPRPVGAVGHCRRTGHRSAGRPPSRQPWAAPSAEYAADQGVHQGCGERHSAAAGSGRSAEDARTGGNAQPAQCSGKRNCLVGEWNFSISEWNYYFEAIGRGFECGT